MGDRTGIDSALHRVAVISATDPAGPDGFGAGRCWATPAGVLSIRNDDDDAWIPLSPDVLFNVPAYDATVTYGSGNIVSSAGSFYLSRIGGNHAHTPASSPTQWQLIGSGSGAGLVDSVVAGTGIFVDPTDPANPIVTNTGVLSVQPGTGITVDVADPLNPIVNAGADPETTPFTQFKSTLDGSITRVADGTVYTNTSGRRRRVEIIAGLIALGPGAGSADIWYSTTIAGVAVGPVFHAAFLQVPVGVARIETAGAFSFVVDPGGTYHVDDKSGGGGSLDYVFWNETDL